MTEQVPLLPKSYFLAAEAGHLLGTPWIKTLTNIAS
jgi:hypothetical protein